MDATGKGLHGEADDVFRIGTVAEQVDAAAERLEKRVRHMPGKNFEFFQRIHLFAQHVDMNRRAARDLQRKIAGFVALRGDKHLRVGQNPVFKVRLGEIALRIGEIIARHAAHFLQDGFGPGAL